MSEQLLHYYNEQLSYLRKQGKAFAETHPKVAGNLSLGPGDVEDPMVARLLEGFAFLSGRVQYNIEQGNQSITENLLSLLYPHYDLPVPAFSIIQLQPSDQLEQAHTIPIHSELRVPTSEDDVFCEFRSCYETDLLPIGLSDIKWQRHFDVKPTKPNENIKTCFSLKLDCLHPELTFKKLTNNKIRFFINLESHLAYSFYEALANNTEEITISYQGLDKEGVELTLDKLKFVGFDEKEAILPYPANSPKSYRILTEYFAYPQKFLFFDIVDLGLLDIPGDLKSLCINVFLNSTDSKCEAAINDDSLLLNCCPIVNLFDEVAEPIHLNAQHAEYHVVPANKLSMRQAEVYSVKSMLVTTNVEGATTDIKATPYFGKKYTMLTDKQHLYWHRQQKKCWEIGEYHLPGTETYLIFSELNASLDDQDKSLIVTPKLLCTNRELTLEIPIGGDSPKFEFHPEKIEQVDSIHCISRISKPRYRKRNRDKQLELLTHISVSQLCYDNHENSIDALKNTLSNYNIDTESDNPMIDKGIQDVKTKTITKRNPNSLKQGFCQGLEYTLTVDEQYFTENNMYLFANVLQYFLQQTCSINSFVQVVLETKQRGVVKRWKPMLGTKKIL